MGCNGSKSRPEYEYDDPSPRGPEAPTDRSMVSEWDGFYTADNVSEVTLLSVSRERLDFERHVCG